MFLLITDILYIILKFIPDYSREKMQFLLRVHAFASLYGWNLSGLAVICRNRDFPIRLNSRDVIFAHWITVMILAPFNRQFVRLYQATSFLSIAPTGQISAHTPQPTQTTSSILALFVVGSVDRPGQEKIRVHSRLQPQFSL